jgi:hypothetical protein
MQDSELIDTWYKGEKFRNEQGELFELVSIHSSKKAILLSSIMRYLEKPAYVSLKDIYVDHKYSKVHVDILGNVYK